LSPAPNAQNRRAHHANEVAVATLHILRRNNSQRNRHPKKARPSLPVLRDPNQPRAAAKNRVAAIVEEHSNGNRAPVPTKNELPNNWCPSQKPWRKARNICVPSATCCNSTKRKKSRRQRPMTPRRLPMEVHHELS
jgi:hypothetical protein